jgi:YHS domain-containing protein
MFKSTSSGPAKEICPICGRPLERRQVFLTFEFIGHEYWFCSQKCYDHFAQMPEKHVAQLAHEPHGHLGRQCPHDRSP